MNEFLDELWGNSRLFLDKNFSLVCDEEVLATILACDEKNFDRFMSLNEFKEILGAAGVKRNIHGVQQAQIGAINALKNSKVSKKKIIDALKRLSCESIIKRDAYDKICYFLDSLAFKSGGEKYAVKENFFRLQKDKSDFIFETLLKLCAKTRFESALKSAKAKIDNLSFTVAVTGVINAGKSSLLNALLNKKILGSSNVPETANLSILKFGEEPLAKVNFWTREELDELGVSTHGLDSALIGGAKEIPMCELKNYTSSGSPLCVFVKSVEIYENLELLKDGICIVDTPGIDDAVFLRERTVKEFIGRCDLMVHLMNVSQTATQKDMDFITDSLTNSRVSRLVIVLTHIDCLSDEQLREVLAYTQKNMRERADKFNVEIDFFAVSSKRYFENVGGSGIEEFKGFLYETLFGEGSEKARLCVSGFKRELAAIRSEFLNEVQDNLLMLSGSSSELSKKIGELKAREEAVKVEREAIRNVLQTQIANIDCTRLETDFRINLKILSKTVNERVQNEKNYGKKDDKRLYHIVAGGLNDGIMHLLRQNRNEILSQLKIAADNISLKFSGFENLLDGGVFNVSEYLNRKGVFLSYGKVCEDVCKSGADAEARLEEFLSADRIRNLVSDLTDFEKQKFISNVEAALSRKDKEFSSAKIEFEKEAGLLKGSDDEISSEILRLEFLKTELEKIGAELKNA